MLCHGLSRVHGCAKFDCAEFGSDQFGSDHLEHTQFPTTLHTFFTLAYQDFPPV